MSRITLLAGLFALLTLARPVVSDGPFTIMAPSSGQSFAMYTNMPLQIDPGFSMATDNDYLTFEVKLGGFHLGNVSLTQLRDGVAYALEPSVPLGMNELTINASRVCQNGTGCPSFRTYLLPLTVQATRQVIVAQGEKEWGISVIAPKTSTQTAQSYKVGDKIFIKTSTTLQDKLGYNAIQSLGGNWTNQTGIQVYVGAVHAGTWTPSQLNAGVNWTVPVDAFSAGPGFYNMALNGPRICNVYITPNCAGTKPVSALVTGISIDGTPPPVTTTSAAATPTAAANATAAVNGTSATAPVDSPTGVPSAPVELALPIGAIIGIVVGGIALIGLLVLLGYCIHRRRLNQIEIEEKYFGTAPKNDDQFGGVTAFHRNSWREPDMDVLARQSRSTLALPNYTNISISASKSAREF